MLRVITLSSMIITQEDKKSADRQRIQGLSKI